MPREVDIDERRAELAAAAARVIARLGIGGATLREVAAEAGWTTGALTHYFANKRELLVFTLSASLDARRARRSERTSLSAEEALQSVLVAALPTDEATMLHWTVTVAFCAQAVCDAELALVQRDAYRDFRADVAKLVRRCGRAAGAAAVTEAERLIATLDGVALQALFDPESWPASRQLAVVDSALKRAVPPRIR